MCVKGLRRGRAAGQQLLMLVSVSHLGAHTMQQAINGLAVDDKTNQRIMFP